ncbi:MAG TPA: proline iminopeptidase-family hydrolase [Gemmatimonadales bacterium]|nr:proline iminopeptidase-family hydrolase [Gemmatimonadales bacterium]
MRLHRNALGLLALTTLACGRGENAVPPDSTLQAASPPLSPGEAYLAVPGGRIWYRTVGTGTGTPAILLHGGPGYSSFYLKSLEALGSDRPLVRYDQLGAGKSDRVTDTTLFTIAHFVAELDSLRAALGYQKIHLVGHSWGTILGLEYYRAHPEHVASLTLASAALDIPAWERNARGLVKTLSDSAQHAIAAAEASHDYASPGYQQALEEFYGRYVFRKPVAADLDSLLKTVNEGIYTYMQGPSEFTITGTIKSYNATDFLKSVKVPVLFTVGEFDEADPPTIRRHAAMTPGASLVVIPGAAHLTTWDNPEAMLAAVRSFLASVDQRKP